MEEEAIAGIYTIKNLATNKVYVGESLDIQQRWKQHIEGLTANIHYNKDLQNDFNKYGKENFEFSIYQKCCKEKSIIFLKAKLLVLECCYINMFKKSGMVYNKANSMKDVLMDNYSSIAFNKNDEVLKKLKSGILYILKQCKFILSDDGLYTIKRVSTLRDMFHLNAIVYNNSNVNILLNSIPPNIINDCLSKRTVAYMKNGKKITEYSFFVNNKDIVYNYIIKSLSFANDLKDISFSNMYKRLIQKRIITKHICVYNGYVNILRNNNIILSDNKSIRLTEEAISNHYGRNYGKSVRFYKNGMDKIEEIFRKTYPDTRLLRE